MEAVRVKASKETGEHLKALREQKGYSQKEAGLKAGFKGGGYIGAFERGEKDLTVRAIKALAAAYEVTENELIGNQKEEKGLAPIEKQPFQSAKEELIERKLTHIKTQLENQSADFVTETLFEMEKVLQEFLRISLPSISTAELQQLVDGIQEQWDKKEAVETKRITGKLVLDDSEVFFDLKKDDNGLSVSLQPKDQKKIAVVEGILGIPIVELFEEVEFPTETLKMKTYKWFSPKLSPYLQFNVLEGVKDQVQIEACIDHQLLRLLKAHNMM